MKIASTVVVVMVLVATARVVRGQEPPQTVVVMPFNALGAPDMTNGIGLSIQKALVAELARMKPVHPVAGAGGAVPVTIESAAKAANDAGANLVIYGSYHLHERNVRITGQVLDVADNRFIGGLKATGAIRDLFAMQDVIAQQVWRILEGRLAPATKAEPVETVEAGSPEPLIEPLGAVRAVPAWEDPDPVVARTRQRLANQDDYDRVNYAYRNAYGFAPPFGLHFGYTYPYYPHVHFHFRSHHHPHHHRHHHR